ncbi:carbon-nitrogen hydrolase [Shimia abyssi]|uniref:Carbon-nitrogen hydrolase n=2 Tax=Shimia abyssi TaxID=1662395 RepID=A0A2P8F8Y5_9RHOB|nr:carbon-nitrogen hydrolase [Shimia abyssi]
MKQRMVLRALASWLSLRVAIERKRHENCNRSGTAVYLDLSPSMERAIELDGKAAQEGANLLVFPEAWFPGYPTFLWRLSPGAGIGKTDELFTRLQANSIDLSKKQMMPLQEAAREHEILLVVGYQELDGAISGSTLYNSCTIIDADGRIVNNHRKLMPTNPERMVWGRVRTESR